LEFSNGKTAVIKQKIRHLLENSDILPSYYALTPFTTQKTLSNMIKSGLVKNDRDGYSVTSANNPGVIFIDDLHLSSVESRPWALIKAFYNYKGWYSMEKSAFMRLDHLTFVSSSSHSFMASQNVFDDAMSNLPQMFIQRMNCFYVPEMGSSEFKTIFKEYTDEILDDADEDWEQLL